MPSSKRSAAAAIQATPESAEVSYRRSALRQQLPERLARLQRILDHARRALDGPDPEASLGYLDRLAHHAKLASRTYR